MSNQVTQTNANAIWPASAVRYLQLTSTAITLLRDSANSSVDNKASDVNAPTALARVVTSTASTLRVPLRSRCM